MQWVWGQAGREGIKRLTGEDSTGHEHLGAEEVVSDALQGRITLFPKSHGSSILQQRPHPLSKRRPGVTSDHSQGR